MDGMPLPLMGLQEDMARLDMDMAPLDIGRLLDMARQEAVKGQGNMGVTTTTAVAGMSAGTHQVTAEDMMTGETTTDGGTMIGTDEGMTETGVGIVTGIGATEGAHGTTATVPGVAPTTVTMMTVVAGEGALVIDLLNGQGVAEAEERRLQAERDSTLPVGVGVGAGAGARASTRRGAIALPGAGAGAGAVGGMVEEVHHPLLQRSELDAVPSYL